MSSHLTISQKIEKLRSIGYYIEERNGGYVMFHEKKNADNPLWVHLFGEPKPTRLTTDREISRVYKIEFEKGKSWKKTVKELTNGIDRAAQRDLIKTEKFEDIPEGKRVKVENPWGWD
jgi:hypothetical protein